MAKFYGQKEIKDIIVDGDKKSVVIFTDDSQIVLPNKMIGVAVTDEATDLTKLRDLRCFPVVAEILKVLLNHNVHIAEIDFISQRVIMSINESCKLGNEELWGASEREQTMIQIQRVLMPKENGVPSPFTNK